MLGGWGGGDRRLQVDERLWGWSVSVLPTPLHKSVDRYKLTEMEKRI